MRRLIITLGDPLSVNVEIIAKSVTQIAACEFPVIVIGSQVQWALQLKELGLSDPAMTKVADAKEPQARGIYFCDAGPHFESTSARDLSAKQRGQLAIAALDRAATLASAEGELAVITMPIDKHSAKLAGFTFPGQTEYFADRWQGQGIMILAGPKLRVGLATNHLPLAAVTAAISTDLIVEKMTLLAASLRSNFGIRLPRIGVCALNPHAGDGGMFGDEDERIVRPAVAKARAILSQAFNEASPSDANHSSRPMVEGPLAADTIFHAAATGRFDAVLAMYHDQGLGPLKTLHFYDAVNLTGGLRHFRVSPDHGPAADLFLCGTARPDSLRQCLHLAHSYLSRKPAL